MTLPVLGAFLSTLPVAELKGELVLLIDSSARFSSKEAYELKIDRNRITVTAATEQGLFYGCQTLEQLVEDAKRFQKSSRP